MGFLSNWYSNSGAAVPRDSSPREDRAPRVRPDDPGRARADGQRRRRDRQPRRCRAAFHRQRGQSRPVSTSGNRHSSCVWPGYHASLVAAGTVTRLATLRLISARSWSASHWIAPRCCAGMHYSAGARCAALRGTGWRA
eukprot:scaffold6362_cov123-Isochrysis_galbana.AAC.5